MCASRHSASSVNKGTWDVLAWACTRFAFRLSQPLAFDRPARSPAAASIPLLVAFRGSLPLPLQTFAAFEPMVTRARPLLILSHSPSSQSDHPRRSRSWQLMMTPRARTHFLIFVQWSCESFFFFFLTALARANRNFGSGLTVCASLLTAVLSRETRPRAKLP